MKSNQTKNASVQTSHFRKSSFNTFLLAIAVLLPIVFAASCAESSSEKADRVGGPRTFTVASGKDEIYVMLDNASARGVGTQGKIDVGDTLSITGNFARLEMAEINAITSNRFRPLTETEREFLKKTQVFLQANQVVGGK